MSSDWLGPDETREALGYLEERFGVPAERFRDHRLLRRREYLFAVRAEVAEAAQAFQRVAGGLRILRVTGAGRYRPATRGAQVYGRWARRNVCDLDPPEVRDLLEGRSLPREGLQGLVLLRSGGVALGVGLVRNGLLVSQLPRGVTENLRLGGPARST